ncbi:hypothetical protein R3I94_020380 [Phoxinus phoxinus]
MPREQRYHRRTPAAQGRVPSFRRFNSVLMFNLLCHGCHQLTAHSGCSPLLHGPGPPLHNDPLIYGPGPPTLHVPELPMHHDPRLHGPGPPLPNGPGSLQIHGTRARSRVYPADYAP